MRLQDQLTEEQTNYEPTEDVQSILTVLAATEAAWITAEIYTAIRAGKLTKRQLVAEELRPDAKNSSGRAEKNTDSTTVPYLPNEQLELVIRTLRHYFVGVYQSWLTAKDVLRDVSESHDVSVSILELDGRVPLTLFSDEYGDLQGNFDELLGRALPAGGKRFSSVLTTTLVL